MNSANDTVTAITANIPIREVYKDYVYTLIIFSSTALLFYATLTTFSQEIEHIWLRPFRLPAMLYIFARYGNLICQGFVVLLNFHSLGRFCNILADVQNAIFVLQGVGVQGLLVIRAYSICEGNKIIISALALGFFSYCSLILYDITAFSGCISSPNINITKLALINFIGDILVVFTDLLIFGICMWKVWGTWRLKCNNGIQSNSSLISVLLTQSILRCCFVITITVASASIQRFTSTFFADGFARMQNALSAILVADFTLDLRRLNSAKIEASQMSLPPLQFSNILQHMHQSLLVEMATPEERNAGENSHDALSGSADDIQAAEVQNI